VNAALTEVEANLRSRTSVPAALANADLLGRVAAEVGANIVPRSSMHDLLFTVRGQDYPFTDSVRVSAEPTSYEITLRRDSEVLEHRVVDVPSSAEALIALLRRLPD